jgi:hypothetical protein
MQAVDYAAQWVDESTCEIEERLAWLEEQLRQSCACPKSGLEVRLRTISEGSTHHVMQCLGCGEQRGNASGDKAARS